MERINKGVIIFLSLVLLVSASVFAEVVTEGAVSKEVSDYVGSFVEKGGIEKGEIKDIKKIDQDDLPDEVEIKQIDKNNVGIYEVNYTEGEELKNIFVVTYSTNEFKPAQVISKNIQYLNFGYSGMAIGSSYLNSATGVGSGPDLGYVMMRPGSITGISTSLTLEKGRVDIRIYKNGIDTGFGNLVSSDDERKIDYDLQSEDVVVYEPGDVIAVYVETIGGASWGDVVTIFETTG